MSVRANSKDFKWWEWEETDVMAEDGSIETSISPCGPFCWGCGEQVCSRRPDDPQSVLSEMVDKPGLRVQVIKDRDAKEKYGDAAPLEWNPKYMLHVTEEFEEDYAEFGFVQRGHYESWHRTTLEQANVPVITRKGQEGTLYNNWKDVPEGLPFKVVRLGSRESVKKSKWLLRESANVRPGHADTLFPHSANKILLTIGQ